MTLRSGRKPSGPLEALRLYSLLDTNTTSSTVIADANRVNAFITDLATGLAESLANPSRLHGIQAQSLFQAMIVGLGGVRLIKEEDVGEFFFEENDGPIRLPDFRIVRRDGQHVLVEVKSVDPSNQRGPHELRASDISAMRRYADLTGARLLLAHYWSAWNLWTVADAGVFKTRGGKLVVDMETAMIKSELGLLGDAMIATVPPLTFSLLAAPPRVTPTTSGQEKEFTVGAIELSAGGNVLTDPVERKIAWFLIQFGRWKLTREVKPDHGRPQRIDLVFAPEEPSPGQPFQVVGQLSSMYSAMFQLATRTEDGQMLGLRHDVTPGMLAELIPSDFFNRQDRALGLWQFELHPSAD